MRGVKTMLFISLFTLPLFLWGCEKKEDVFSGTIEGNEIYIQAEIGGILDAIHVKEGDAVEKGQALIQLDEQPQDLLVRERKAAADAAKIKLEEAKAGSRVQEIARAEAAVQQADAFYQQKIEQTKASHHRLEQAEFRVQEARRQLEGARQTLKYREDAWQKRKNLYQEGAVSQAELDQAQEAYDQALNLVQQWESRLASANQELKAAEQELRSMNAAGEAARASLQQSEAQLRLLQEGATDYTVRQLSKQWEQANFRYEQALVQKEKLSLEAPVSGTVLRINTGPGEVAQPGMTLMTLLEERELEVTVYVPEHRLNLVRMGTNAVISVDAYPDEEFRGTVTHIANEAEFIPKNVQTPDERTKMVFAVTVTIQEGLERLKPGMPADVRFAQEGESDARD